MNCEDRELRNLMMILLSVTSVSGPSLVFDSVSRAHVASYLCIASNGVPPSVSKRVDLRVQCELREQIIYYDKRLLILISVPPMVEVEREVVKARIGGNATLKCKSEAFPPSENFWTLTSHETISSGEEAWSPYLNNDHDYNCNCQEDA